ncbi:hypothetical protein ACSDR0_22450, partial [Streptosporangium sp. G11]
PPDAVRALVEGDDGGPVREPAGAATTLVAVPRDVEALRRADPRATAAWRVAVREVLGGLLEEGCRVTGFDREAGYVVERRPGGEPRPAERPRRHDDEVASTERPPP